MTLMAELSGDYNELATDFQNGFHGLCGEKSVKSVEKIR